MPSSSQFIASTVEETVRARRRRQYITESMDFRLLALQTVDHKIDRNLRALKVFGADAADLIEQQIATETHQPTLDALIHIGAAHAVNANNVNDDLLGQWCERFGEQHPSALRDAWWFYPEQRSNIARHVQRIMRVVQDTRQTPRLLGVELAGRWGMRESVPHIQYLAATTQDGPLRRMCELSLCRLGHAPRDLKERILRLDDQTEELLHSLQMVAISGQTNAATADMYFRCTDSSNLETRHLGWCLATLASPARAYSLAKESNLIEPGLRVRVQALAGYPQGLVDVMAEIAEQAGPVNAPQMDALLMYLGEVPMEASATNIDAKEREQALRTRVLRVFQDAHIPVTNAAKHSTWNIEQMLVQHDPAQSRRLRFGSALLPSDGLRPSLGGPVMQLCTLMRQALYIEQAALERQPVAGGLSAYASARHQVHVIGLSDWIGEARASTAQHA